MTMKRIVLLGLTAALLAASSTALADDWECRQDSQSKCYVTHVRYFPGATSYVRAKLHDPAGATTCTHVRFQLDSGVTSEDALRGVEAVLLTALTTGLPIQFWRLTDHGDDADCYAATVIISKQGH